MKVRSEGGRITHTGGVPVKTILDGVAREIEAEERALAATAPRSSSRSDTPALDATLDLTALDDALDAMPDFGALDATLDLDERSIAAVPMVGLTADSARSTNTASGNRQRGRRAEPARKVVKPTRRAADLAHQPV